MTGETDLVKLLKTMQPELSEREYVFCSVTTGMAAAAELNPWAVITEDEGLTVILEAAGAAEKRMPYDSVYKRITLHVHSSLNAVGLTAAVAAELASRGISANVVAGYYHDHLFVQAEHAEKALSALRDLSARNRG
jgi:hypothetical protein